MILDCPICWKMQTMLAKSIDYLAVEYLTAFYAQTLPYIYAGIISVSRPTSQG